MKLAKHLLVFSLVLAALIACKPTPEIIVVEVTSTTRPTDISTNTPEPTVTPTPVPPTNTPRPTNTPKPTRTPVPTATPDPNLVQPGTHLVGTDIQPGLYRGQTAPGGSCYWARLKDVSGSIDAIIANDNSVGQFYIDVADGDYALETKCRIVLLNSLPEPPAEFPQSIKPGMYIVGVDIQPGTYKGEAGIEITNSCYWARLRDFSGEIRAILANDNATGQYYVQVQTNDFGLATNCELERVRE